MGILGGIGSGKSSVVRRIRSPRLFIIDADKIGHNLLSDTQIQDSLRNQFGNGIFSEPTVVDRTRPAARVFGETTAHKTALIQLNQILHPPIRKQIRTQIQSSHGAEAVVLDAALLLESGWQDECDWLIFVDTPTEKRQERVAVNRQWSAEELKKREDAQWSIARKKQLADFIVDNSGSIEDAAEQMTEVFHSILRPAEGH